MSERIEATVQRTFLHDNKTVRRGDKITGSNAVMQQLAARRLVVLSDARAAEQAKGDGEIAGTDTNSGSGAGGDAVGHGQSGSTGDRGASPSAGELLVTGSAAESVTRVKEAKDLDQLKEARAAEQAKGDGARKTVLDALEAAIAAAEPPKG